MAPYESPPPTLEPRHREHLEQSAISDEVINQRGYLSIVPGAIHDWRKVAGDIHSDELLRKVLHQGALAFPLFRCAEAEPYTWVLRPDQPRRSPEGKPIKYEYPRNTPNILDILPIYRDALTNPHLPVWITEGCKKADSLASAYGSSIVPINENGVWGWRSKGKLLDDFKKVIWEGRRVVIAPDGDVRHNKQVYAAVQRTASLLVAWGASEVLICLLPQPKDGPKIGIDDYLADGHSLTDIESHLVEIDTVKASTRAQLMKHPSTGEPLYLPSGYDVVNKNIVRVDRENAQAFYSGLIAVTGTGQNLHTNEEVVTVVWDRFNRLHEATVPRLALTSGVRTAEALGHVGAFIHSINAREMSRYLVEFIRENDETLPRQNLVDRWGTTPDGGVVLPAGSIGIDQPTKFTGSAIQVGTDRDAYRRVISQIAGTLTEEGWSNIAQLWAILGMGLAGPALSRLKPDRYPVLMLAGNSTSGKSTLTHFVTGAYGFPRLAPLQVQCGSGSTTPKGIQQVLSVTNGLPVHLEDVHMLMEREPMRFAGLIYDFANGQLRTYGTLDQKGGGGQSIGGALLMTGEVLPQFSFEGSQRRVMLFDCTQQPPLGVPARSGEGARRAAILNSAWGGGAGLWGHQVCERIWGDWPQFLRDIALFQNDPTLNDLQAWKLILASGMATLRTALLSEGIVLDWAQLLRTWAAILVAGQKANDPARDAFDRILVMLSQGELMDNASSDGKGNVIAPSWRWIYYDRKMIAAQRFGDDYWRVMVTSPQWLANIGPGVVDRFGETWLQGGLLTAHKGKRPVSDKSYLGPGKSYLQCILIPDRYFSVYANHEGIESCG